MVQASAVEQTPSRQEFLERQPTYWLKRAYQAMRRKVDAELRPLGISLSQRDALLAVRHGGGMSLTDLTERLRLEQSSVSRLALGLSRRGLLAIGEDASDRRSRRVSITQEGIEILDATPGASRVAGAALTEALTSEELERLVNLLRKAAVQLEQPNGARNAGRGTDDVCGSRGPQ